VSFRVLVTHQAKKELRRLPLHCRQTLLNGLNRHADDPSPDGRSIVPISAGRKGSLRQLRIGEYRVFFEVEESDVFVLRCVHRQDLEKAIRQLPAS
jgi:mRNA-degrading endonuclease RelE of RelBE toxin-antitoxin system